MIKSKATVIGQLLTIFIRIVYANTTESDVVHSCDSTAASYENYTTPRTDLCDCNKKSLCVRKCCQTGFYYSRDKNLHTGFHAGICIKNNGTNFSVPIYNDVIKQYDLKHGFIVGMLSCNNTGANQHFKLNNEESREKFFIQDDGTLYYPLAEKAYGRDRYCVDDRAGLTAHVCSTPTGSFYYAAKIIHYSANLASLPFLLITYVILALVTDANLRDICSKFYAMALIFGYISLALAQYYGMENYYFCQTLGFSTIFFMIASFLWMNAFSVVTWCTFSTLKRCYMLKMMKEELLVTFSFYAWGTPGVLVAILFFLNTFGDTHARYYPGMGSPLCFLNGHLPTLVYYFGPILIITVINTVLSILTTINMLKLRKELSTLKAYGSKRSKGRENRRVYWKLFFVVCINPLINIHVVQAIAWVAGWKLNEDTAIHVSFAKDIAYATYGFFVFVIFGTRKKHWRLLKQRCLRQKQKSAYSRPPTTIYMATLDVCR